MASNYRYRYPLTYEDSEVFTNKIKFSAYSSLENEALAVVLLHTPQNLSFADNADYSAIDLGAIGQTAANAANQAIKDLRNGGAEAAGNNLIVAGANAFSSILGGKGVGVEKALSNLGQAAIQQVAPESIKNIAKLSAKQVMNPFTNTLFNRMTVRNFAFSFRMIASSRQEAKVIKQIVEVFRSNMYPELEEGTAGAILKFPAVWNIKFLYGSGSYSSIDGGNWKENEFIPKIHKCFLTSCSTAINSSANSYHDDGAPFDITCDLNFMETKTYSKNTILTGDEE